MQAIILSGGKGTRLYPLTKNCPKPMLRIGNKPHLQYQIELLKQHGITDIIFSTGYLHEQIEEYFESGLKFGVNIQYKEDGAKPLGTGGAIANCVDLIESENVLVLNGDILTNINLSNMIELHTRTLVPMTMALTPVINPEQFGVAKVNRGKIIDFIEKPEDGRVCGNLINAGIYIINRDVIQYSIPNEFCMIEKDVFPKFANASLLNAYIAEFYWIDIGTHDRFEKVQKDVNNFF
jgi:mannose-1-phosphate guanylyltransferase/phosphomannomutase